MTIQQTALAASWRAVKAAAGVSVTLARGASTVAIKAVKAETQADDVDEAGGLLTVRVRDFLIHVDDYKVSSAKVEPQNGDTITQVVNGKTRVFELMTDNNQPVWRFHEGYGETVYRVHTKHVSTA